MLSYEQEKTYLFCGTVKVMKAYSTEEYLYPYLIEGRYTASDGK